MTGNAKKVEPVVQPRQSSNLHNGMRIETKENIPIAHIQRGRRNRPTRGTITPRVVGTNAARGQGRSSTRLLLTHVVQLRPRGRILLIRHLHSAVGRQVATVLMLEGGDWLLSHGLTLHRSLWCIRLLLIVKDLVAQCWVHHWLLRRRHVKEVCVRWEELVWLIILPKVLADVWRVARVQEEVGRCTWVRIRIERCRRSSVGTRGAHERIGALP